MWVLKKAVELRLKNIYLKTKGVPYIQKAAVNKSLGLILSFLK